MIYELNTHLLNIKVDSIYSNTIQDFFDEFIPSKKIQHLLIQNKWITLDGNPVKRESDIVGINLTIDIYPETYEYKKCNLNLDVVYEDEFLLIVNKPKDILVHGDGSDEITLNNIVESYLVDRPYISAYPIHRLDKETTGLVVYSKSIIFQPLLDLMLSQKKIRRNYFAFVEGIMEIGKSQTINKPIGKDRHNSNKRVIYEGGQEAITKIKCLGYSKKNNYSIVECSLDTGRTHQIRVHMASIKHPLLNDKLYGKESSLIKRMGLFAYKVEMYHPIKEESIKIECDLSNDLGTLYSSIL